MYICAAAQEAREYIKKENMEGIAEAKRWGSSRHIHQLFNLKGE